MLFFKTRQLFHLPSGSIASLNKELSSLLYSIVGCLLSSLNLIAAATNRQPVITSSRNQLAVVGRRGRANETLFILWLLDISNLISVFFSILFIALPFSICKMIAVFSLAGVSVPQLFIAIVL